MSSIANVIDDAGKIALDLVPPGSQLNEIVGVLVKHVEALAGGELAHLADQALGITPEVTTAEPSSSPAAPAADVAALQATVDKLTAELAAVRTAVGQGA